MPLIIFVTMNRTWLMAALTLSSLLCYSQEMIFPDLQGEALELAVREEFKPKFVELFSRARTLLYREIYNDNDTVHTFYTDHKLYLPKYERHPIQYLAQEASPDGIRTDHIFPKTKGAEESNGNAFSDMHNLIPVKWEIADLKSGAIYGDIADSASDLWLYSDEKLNSAKTLSNEDITKYSELKLGNTVIFEPKETVKGDIARSIFYFYTMYKKEALAADPQYFNLMKKDLCKWHRADPVDDAEIEKNDLIAAYQDDKLNPFIVDPTLAERIYCNPDKEISAAAPKNNQVKSYRLNGDFNPQIKVFPNTANQSLFKLDISNIHPRDYQLEIFDVSGKLIYSLAEKLDYFNTINMWNVNSGIYYLHLKDLTTGKKFSDVFKIIKS